LVGGGLLGGGLLGGGLFGGGVLLPVGVPGPVQTKPPVTQRQLNAMVSWNGRPQSV